jgi:outer membrane lipoprotein carrier protein
MKRSKMIGLLLMGVWSLGVNNATAQTQQDPKAKEVLDGVSKKFSTLKSVVANFVLKIEGGASGMNESRSGSVFVKGTKYKVVMGDQEIISDNKTSWTYSKDINEVTISTVDPKSEGITPAKIFTNFYDKDFLYRFAGESTQKGKVVQHIEMTPTDKTKAFFKVNVDVDKKTQTLTRMQVFEKNGNRYTYEINGFTPNGAVTDATFVFDAKKYPGVEVIDLR